MQTTQLFKKLLQINLGLASGHRLVIVTDDRPFQQPTPSINDRQQLANAIAETAKSLGITTDVYLYPSPNQSGTEPPIDIFSAVYPKGFVDFLAQHKLTPPLLDKKLTPEELEFTKQWLSKQQRPYDALLALSGYSITHTRFRKLINESLQVRAATMPGVEPFMFDGVMQADWKAVAQRSIIVAKALSAATQAEILTASGHRLTFSLEGRMGTADTGLLNQEGAFGNLPGGEAFIAPVEGSANGTVAVGPRENPGIYAFRFDKGNMVEILGNPPFQDKLEKLFTQMPLARNLAELGVGTNEKANHPDNILEAEKILGTLHLALGDNASFGGNTSVPFHQDYVVYQPTLKLYAHQLSPQLIIDHGHLRVDLA